MAYVISASTLKSSITVVRSDASDALVKIHEFEDLGLAEIAVAADNGRAVTREQLLALVAQQEAAAGPDARR